VCAATPNPISAVLFVIRFIGVLGNEVALALDDDQVLSLSCFNVLF
jgi:hypothetical protein